MQIGTAGLKFSVVGVEVSVADAIRRPNIKRICVKTINKLRIKMGEGTTGYCRIIERKCRIKSGDSAERIEVGKQDYGKHC